MKDSIHESAKPAAGGSAINDPQQRDEYVYRAVLAQRRADGDEFKDFRIMGGGEVKTLR